MTNKQIIPFSFSSVSRSRSHIIYYNEETKKKTAEKLFNFIFAFSNFSVVFRQNSNLLNLVISWVHWFAFILKKDKEERESLRFGFSFQTNAKKHYSENACSHIKNNINYMFVSFPSNFILKVIVFYYFEIHQC